MARQEALARIARGKRLWIWQNIVQEVYTIQDKNLLHDLQIRGKEHNWNKIFITC